MTPLRNTRYVKKKSLKNSIKYFIPLAGGCELDRVFCCHEAVVTLVRVSGILKDFLYWRNF